MDKSVRNTDIWLRSKIKKEEDQVGPGYYSFKTKVILNKESFNYGNIPFGTGMEKNHQIGDQSSFIKRQLPGPGSYNLSADLQHLTRNRTGVIGNTSSFKSRSPKISYLTSIQKQEQMNQSTQDQRESQLGLVGEVKQKYERKRNIDNERFSTIRNKLEKSMNQIQKIEGVNEFIRDKQLSPAYLRDASQNIAAQIIYAPDDIYQTTIISRVQANQMKNEMNQTVQQQVQFEKPATKNIRSKKISGGKSPTVNHFKNLSISQQSIEMTDYNTSIDGGNVGPGLYNPKHSLVLKNSPSATFGPPGLQEVFKNPKATSNNTVSVKKQVEDYLYSVLGEEKEQAKQNKADRQIKRLNNSFDIVHAQNKSSQFASNSNRTNFANSITPGPGSYLQDFPLDMQTNVMKRVIQSKVNFGSYSERNTDIFTRNPKFPFNEQSSKNNPSTGYYSLKQYSDFNMISSPGKILQQQRTLESQNKEFMTSSQGLKNVPTIQIEVNDPKRDSQLLLGPPGPGYYDPIMKDESRNKGLPRKNKSVGFNSQTPRFKVKKQEVEQNKNDSPTLKAQLLIDQLQKQLSHQDKQSSMFQSRTSRMFPEVFIKKQEEYNLAEQNLVINQQRYQDIEGQRKQLTDELKQKNPNKSFNGSSSPRFKHQSKQYLVLANNKCPILGTGHGENTVVIEFPNRDSRDPQPEQLPFNLKGGTVSYLDRIGPGTYDHHDSISSDKQKSSQKGTSPFKKSKRSEMTYLQQALVEKAYTGSIGDHYNEQSFVKKSFNAGLIQQSIKSIKQKAEL
ncbi:UNKNOWN [Stylonychia lemnae]|uniref:Uncharacterized protein n=1 Tax=Stylonychia lemnae TaxID=5949 RepID=A0A078AEV1_STYLE|nr:UNKNOWN [Stylonychia lemnae]|eukprot:CDW80037.1 UNKNOWN [Stylonychia lemnae]